jgi:hypothetical protein
MRWSIFPFTLTILAICLIALVRFRSEPLTLRNVRFTGFISSALLTLVGFFLGAMIQASTTLVPGHYHASIGSVTVAFMAASFVLIEKIGYSTEHLKNPNWIAYQPIIFSFGQFIFACGFSLSGLYGQGRKLYGAEQSVRGPIDYLGLTLMSIGGFVAVVGGVLFLILVLRLLKSGSKDGFILYRYNKPEVMYEK